MFVDQSGVPTFAQYGLQPGAAERGGMSQAFLELNEHHPLRVTLVSALYLPGLQFPHLENGEKAHR